MKHKLIVVNVILLFYTSAFAQESQRIRYVESASESKIEFLSPTGEVINTVDVRSTNKYSQPNNSSARISEGAITTFSLRKEDKQTTLDAFFLTKSQGDIQKLEPASLKTLSDVSISERHAVVANQLMLCGEQGGFLGIKSIASVYDEMGNKIATLPENNEGYIESVVSKNGKYLSALFGDVVTESDYSLMPVPGFRIYEISSGQQMYELLSTNEYDVLPPISLNDMIIEVLRFPEGRYHYMVFFPDRRIIYKKIFTREEIEKFVRFETDGFVVREGTSEVLLEYPKFFESSTF